LEDVLRQFSSVRDLSPSAIATQVVDILLVAYLLYRLLLLVRGTRAWRILMGVVGFVLLLWLSAVLQLNTFHWILDKATLLAPVALVILLLPELRQAIEGLGKIDFWSQALVPAVEERAEARTVEEIVAAVSELATASVGALIVIEKGARLEDLASNGVFIGARVSAPLLGAIFYEGNPLHDGAAIIRSDMIVAAACRLPLSESSRLDSTVHMRHRAAVGVTEMFDCIGVVVSEERGTISFASEGRLRRLDSHIELRDLLNRELRGGAHRAAKSKPKKNNRSKEPSEAANK
jgi:diadenylate cyclase